MSKISPLLIVLIALVSATFDYGQTEQKADSIVVNVITIDELKEIIKDRKGKPLVINLWATWCVPCREEFPDLITLSNKYAENVEVIGISLDYPDEIDSKILPFLFEQDPGFVNYVNGEKDSEKFINNLNEEWSGAIPAAFFYDSSGKQIMFYQEKLSFEEMEDAVLNLIKK